MQKKKKNTASRIGTLPFVGLWSMTYALGWATLAVSALVIDNFNLDFLFGSLPVVVIFGLFGFVPGLVSSIGQQWLLRAKLGLQASSWWLWSTLGWIIGGASLRFIDQLNAPMLNEVAQLAIILAFMLIPPAIAQAWLLRRHIRQSWLFMGAALTGSALFSLTGYTFDPDSDIALVLTVGLAGLAQGAVMGMTLLWLFAMSHRPEQHTRSMDRLQSGELDGEDSQWEQSDAIDSYEDDPVYIESKSR